MISRPVVPMISSLATHNVAEISAIQLSSFNVFDGVPPLSLSADEAAYYPWFSGCVSVLLKNVTVDSVILIPAAPPNDDERVSFQYFGTSIMWLLQLKNISPSSSGNKFYFKILGSTVADDPAPLFVKHSIVIMEIPNNDRRKVLNLILDSELAKALFDIVKEKRIALPASLPTSTTSTSTSTSTSSSSSSSSLASNSTLIPNLFNEVDGGGDGAAVVDANADVHATTSNKRKAGGGATGFNNSSSSDGDGVNDAIDLSNCDLLDEGKIKNKKSSADEHTGEKFFRDLDGNKRYLRNKEGSSVIQLHQGLFRLLDSDRVKQFLNDYRLSVMEWRDMISTYGCLPNNHDLKKNVAFASLHKFTLCRPLIVWNDLNLLEKFIKGNWSYKDWVSGGLNLSHFLTEADRNVVWSDQSTVIGRLRLVTALKNLQLMCAVNFDQIFEDTFDYLCNFIISVEKVSHYHDLYLRFRIEQVIYLYFVDVCQKENSLCVPGAAMSNPAACSALLKVWIHSFTEQLLEEEVAPHPHFYSPNGNFNEIRFDLLTFNAIRNQTVSVYHPANSGAAAYNNFNSNVTFHNAVAPWIPPSSSSSSSSYLTSTPLIPFASSNNSINHASLNNPNSSAVTVQNRSSISNGDNNNSGVKTCLWWIGQQCHGSINGEPMTCKVNKHSKLIHAPISTITLQAALQALEKTKWQQNTKDLFEKLFKENKRMFASY